MKAVVAISMLAAAIGVQAQGMSMPMKAGASANVPAAVPLVDGEVRKLDPDKVQNRSEARRSSQPRHAAHDYGF